MSIAIQINLETKTCSCGTVYAVPSWALYSCRCPMCAHRENKKLHERIDHRDRRISSLQGVITRMKNERKDFGYSSSLKKLLNRGSK